MFGIVSTGPSSIAIDLTYDRKRLDEAINKISGAGLKPNEILDVPDGAQGPPEVRYRAHVAFSTANDIMKNLEQVHNRRKAFIYVSNGYDFNPFSKTRAKKQDAERYAHDAGRHQNADGERRQRQPAATTTDPFKTQGNKFSRGRPGVGAVGADARTPTAPTPRSTRSTRAVSSACPTSTRRST